eukprot:COSAG01_NODE_5028_length_4537_cov_4.829428_3_plen_118_part_00
MSRSKMIFGQLVHLTDNTSAYGDEEVEAPRTDHDDAPSAAGVRGAYLHVVDVDAQPIVDVRPANDSDHEPTKVEGKVQREQRAIDGLREALATELCLPTCTHAILSLNRGRDPTLRG